MRDPASAVRVHYQGPGDGQDAVARIAALLARNFDPLSAEALAGLDQFHVGGLEATRALGGTLDLRPGLHVLDAGSGLGGPSRDLVAVHGVRVTGVDLTPAYVGIARLLAERSGVADRVDYQVGDLLALPFADDTFDAAYTQHVVMNIADRDGLYRELHRVLKPGARFGFYDVLIGDRPDAPDYPVPWAADPSTSFLLTEAQTRATLAAAGFVEQDWRDVTASALGWAVGQQAAAGAEPNLGMIMGPRMAQMASNLFRNLSDGRLRLVMSVWTPSPD